MYGLWKLIVSDESYDLLIIRMVSRASAIPYDNRADADKCATSLFI